MSDAASVALGAVVLGALLGGVVQAVIAWGDRVREGRAAALVISDSIDAARRAAARCEDDGFLLQAEDFGLFVAAWNEHRTAVARVIPADTFATVANCFAGILRLAIIQERFPDDSGHFTAYEHLHDVIDSCEAARRALLPLTSGRRGYKRENWTRERRQHDSQDTRPTDDGESPH